MRQNWKRDPQKENASLARGVGTKYKVKRYIMNNISVLPNQLKSSNKSLPADGFLTGVQSLPTWPIAGPPHSPLVGRMTVAGRGREGQCSPN